MQCDQPWVGAGWPTLGQFRVTNPGSVHGDQPPVSAGLHGDQPWTSAGWQTPGQCRVTRPWSVQGYQPLVSAVGQCNVTNPGSVQGDQLWVSAGDLQLNSPLAHNLCSPRLTEETVMQLSKLGLCLVGTSFWSVWLWNPKREIRKGLPYI